MTTDNIITLLTTYYLQFSIPDIPIVPLFTPIPYTLRIVTRTKQMRKDDADQKSQKLLFPSPPTRLCDVQFYLKRHLVMKAHLFTTKCKEKATDLGAVDNTSSNNANGMPVAVEIKERDWVPSDADENVGTWLQESTFRSAFTLTCVPSFETETLQIKVRSRSFLAQRRSLCSRSCIAFSILWI